MMYDGWVVTVATTFVRGLCGVLRCANIICADFSPWMLKGIGFGSIFVLGKRPRRSVLSVWWRSVWSRLVIMDWSVSRRWIP